MQSLTAYFLVLDISNLHHLQNVEERTYIHKTKQILLSYFIRRKLETLLKGDNKLLHESKNRCIKVWWRMKEIGGLKFTFCIV